MLPYTYEDKTIGPRALAVHDALGRVYDHHYATTENAEDTYSDYV